MLCRHMAAAAEVRGEKEGPLFTRIRRIDTLINDRLTDQAVYPVSAKLPASSDYKIFLRR